MEQALENGEDIGWMSLKLYRLTENLHLHDQRSMSQTLSLLYTIVPPNPGRSGTIPRHRLPQKPWPASSILSAVDLASWLLEQVKHQGVPRWPPFNSAVPAE